MYSTKIGCGGKKLIKDRIYSIVQTILIGLFAYAVINIIGIAIHYNEGNKIYSDSQEKYFFVNPKQTDDETEKYEVDIENLQKINPDVVGWIYIKNSNVSYPLIHYTDNEKYLKKTYDNHSSSFGSIFIDYRNDPNLLDRNSIIYGHNTKNGSMFGSLKKYKDASFLNDHSKINIIYKDAVFEYEVFSIYTTLDTGPAYIIDFLSDNEFKNFLTAITSLSDVQTGIKPDVSDKIITLSTCTSRTQDERFVVHAKLVNITAYDENIKID